MRGSSILDIDLEKIRYNSIQVVEKCHQQGIAVLGVTKGFGAVHQIAFAMVEGGVDGLADARMENILELRKRGFTQPMTLLRIPNLSNVANVVQYADTSLNSEITVIKALAHAAQKINKIHQVILMVDVGDLREGLLQENVVGAAGKIAGFKGVKLSGLGTNIGCFSGVLPSSANLRILVELASSIEKQLGYKIEIISGGATSSLSLVENHQIPSGVNQLRIGEGILLGTDSTNGQKIPWLHQDAFLLRAEVIEVNSNPRIKHAMIAIGALDVDIEGIRPVDDGLIILEASNDQLLLDITESKEGIKVGDQIKFSLTYSGLLSASHSKNVEKRFMGETFQKRMWSGYQHPDSGATEVQGVS
jgi:predicted amino acid racemase